MFIVMGCRVCDKHAGWGDLFAEDADANIHTEVRAGKARNRSLGTSYHSLHEYGACKTKCCVVEGLKMMLGKMTSGGLNLRLTVLEQDPFFTLSTRVHRTESWATLIAWIKHLRRVCKYGLSLLLQ
jgi:hypothetical protein